MRITASERDGIRVLACEGALTIGTAADSFEAACGRAAERGARGLLLDLSRLTYLDSAGVGSVVACAKFAAKEGTVVKVVLEPGSAAQRIFTVTQLERAFEVFEDVGTAIASFA
jgi:anti-sigma B factor antagonist